VISVDTRYAAHAGVLIAVALAGLAAEALAGHRSGARLVVGFCIAATFPIGADLLAKAVPGPERLAEQATELAPWVQRQPLAGYLPRSIAWGGAGLAIVFGIGWVGGVSADGIGFLMGLGVVNALRAVRVRRFETRTGTRLFVGLTGWRAKRRYYVESALGA
jgi:hypothetical protein